MMTRPAKILVVDDFRTNILYLKRLLGREGHEVLGSDTADEAVERIASEEFDLVLLDIVMPGADGYKICELIRKSALNAATPVIFITSRNDEKSIVKGFELGGQDYIIRPFNDRELIARVSTHVELKRNRAQLKMLNEKLEKTVSKRTHELKTALAKLKLSYKKLKSAQKESLRLDKIKENFLKIINHEIRTPLNGILGIHELIKVNSQDEELHSYLEMMEHSVNRLEKFSMDALFLTELKTGMYRVHVESLSVGELIAQTLMPYESRIMEAGIFIHFDIQQATIHTDRNLLRYSLGNLIENALYHTPRHHTIVIRGEKGHGKSYQISVLDSGHGFPVHVIENKYRLFLNEDFSDNRPGLALYTISLIMKYLKGKMLLSNIPEGGASVMLKLKPLHPYS
jgi:two-component system, sensor histidine kinase and response regulator